MKGYFLPVILGVALVGVIVGVVWDLGIVSDTISEGKKAEASTTDGHIQVLEVKSLSKDNLQWLAKTYLLEVDGSKFLVVANSSQIRVVGLPGSEQKPKEVGGGRGN